MRRFCCEVIPNMQQQGWVRIVNVSSIGGIYPNANAPISHAISAAINNFTQNLALNVSSIGILVNAVAVGAIITNNWVNNMLPNIRARRNELRDKSDDEITAILAKEKLPVGYFGYPEDIATITAFLLSKRNRFITGQTIQVSRGAERFM